MPTIKTQYKISDALNYAVVAFHLNNDRVIRDDHRSESGDVLANRNYIQGALEGKMKLAITKAIKKEAEGIKQYLEQVRIIQSLKGRRDDQFLESMLELLAKETVTGRDLGLLAWAPKVANDYHKKDATAEITAQYEHSSQWIGKIKDKIMIDFTAIEIRFVPSMGIHSVFGHDEHDNLVHYWASEERRIIQRGLIQARVNKQINDKYHNNAKVTVINYVKEIK